ncbi:MAG: TolC family protein [Hydrogenovibrio sp.]|nr:TolC family protein [Hydrogenovibrio sp.]
MLNVFMKSLAAGCLMLTLSAPVFAMPQAPMQVLTQNLQLQKLFERALAQNPGLALADAQTTAALNAQRQAQSYEKPEVHLTSELSYAWMQKKDFARTANQLVATYPLYEPDKADLNQAAGYRHGAAQSQFESQRQKLLLAVASRYFQYWAQKAQYDFLMKERDSISSIMSQQSKRFQVGYQDLNDITEVQARLDNNQADLLEAKQAMDVTQSNLEALVGGAVDLSRLSPPKTLPKPIVLQGDGASDDWRAWVENNPDIQALNQSELAADSQVTYEKNKDGVQLQAFGAYVYNDSDGNYYDDMQGAKGGIQLSVPLYLGGRTHASVAQARAKSSQVSAQKRQKLLRLQADAKNAFLQYQAGLARLEALKAALHSNLEAVKATENGLRTGTRNILDLLNAQRSLHKAQRDLPTTRAKIWQSWYQFYWALGLLKADE